MIFSRRGQNLVDLALLIGLVGLAIVGMEVYLKRGMQGKVKDLTDYIISSGQKANDNEEGEETESGSSSTSTSNMTINEFGQGAKHLNAVESSSSTYWQEEKKDHAR